MKSKGFTLHTKIFLALVDINRLPSSDGKQGPYITYKDIFGSSRYKQASNRFPMMKSKGLTLHTKTSVLIAAADIGNSKASRFCGLAPGARSKSNMLWVTQDQSQTCYGSHKSKVVLIFRL